MANIHGSSREEKEGNQGKLGRLEGTVAQFDEKLEVTKGGSVTSFSVKLKFKLWSI